MRHLHFKNFLIMRHTITRVRTSGRAPYTHVWSIAGTYIRKYKVSYPEGAAAAELATATADDVYVHQIQCCIRGYHDVCQRIWYPTIGEILGTAREQENTHDRYAVAVCRPTYWRGCILGWALKKPGYPSVFRARHGYDRFETRLNYASQILIMCHRAPKRILIYVSPFKNNYFSGDV